MWAASIIFITLLAIAMTLALVAIVYGFVKKQMKFDFENAKAYIQLLKKNQKKEIKNKEKSVWYTLFFII